ncbi:P-loop NTPase fold protein [Plebeiibacterium sediminum]|uniref:P-loop NTPase fold protein n=1 Tax=Plebeiibacterium sediminum TaxID=2992112 RepID=A0AAE3SGH0_9BACT|nr:P-loop NTPase fold protein [Plebeiobacterium sediminum]MCW3788490.1 P-loop NTPase fold protein [Plebeiobacterium sediminum]
MSKQQYTPSVNIIRDYDKELNYIVTPNATQIAKSIVNHYKTTGHCFNIIGSYGTGKSSFIWAMEQSLNRKKDFFYEDGNAFNNADSYDFINLVGSYSSILESLGKRFGVSNITPDNVIEGIDNYYKKIKQEGKFLIVVIDEYGKFLEYAAKNSSEESIYFIQQLAEYINLPERNIVLMTSLHQNFAQYGSGLNTKEKNEWNKVNGRFIDLTFNEPVEQLLYLAGERIKQWGFKKPSTNEVNKAILHAKIIKNASAFDIEFGNKIFPLDLSSASCLTLALQLYGQNERSLFTFLNRQGFNSLYEHAETGNRFHLGKVHDFIIENFYGFIISSSNPHKSGWDAIRIALEKIETNFNGEFDIAELIIKAIGLLNIFAPKGGKIDKNLIIDYLPQYSAEVIDSVVDQLEKKQIIRFRSYSSRYILFEGTDLDFDKELEDAKKKVTSNKNVANAIKKIYNLPYILAKSISYQLGTPRFFEYIISETPVNIRPEGELDGYINLVFSEEITAEEVQNQSASEHAILYAYFERTGKIKNLLNKIDRIEFVIQQNPDDKVALSELNKLKDATLNELSTEILTNLISGKSGVKWFSNGKNIRIRSQKELNKRLSKICQNVYSSTPLLRNELLNKHKLSAAISSARKNFFTALLDNSDKEDIGFQKDKYPAEKTIYLSLLKNTGLHKKDKDDRWGFVVPDESSPIYSLWEKSMEILNRGKIERINVKTFYDELSIAPFKLKDGLLSFWVPTFLHINQDNYALFNDKGYVPFLTKEVIEVFPKTYKDYTIKTFSVDGIKLNLLNTYRSLINKSPKEIGDRSVYIETIRPLFVFYRDLPEYTKQTKNISSEALNFRNAIHNASDPETAFFVDIPKSLGYSGIDLKNESIDLEQYLKQLKDVIRELRECEQDLINQLEQTIKKIIGAPKANFAEYKKNLEERLGQVNIEIISSTQKRLLSRILMPSSRKSEWIKGLFNSLLNKGFDKIVDEEIPVFITKFKSSFKELERLVDLHKLNKSRSNESVYSIDIIDERGKVKNENIILPVKMSSKYKESESLINELISKLSKEEQKALLVKTLQQLI